MLITHELGPALGVADRVVVCPPRPHRGARPRPAFAGDGAALAHPYSRALWRALPQNDFACVADPR